MNYHKYSADELAAYVGHRTCFTVGVGNRPQSWQQEIKGNVHGVNGPNGSNGSNMRSPGPVERPSGGDWEYLLAEGAKVMTDRDTLAGQVQHMEYMREHELRQSERLVRQVRFLERHVNQLERAVKVTKRWEDKVEMTVGGALTKVQYNGLRLHLTLAKNLYDRNVKCVAVLLCTTTSPHPHSPAPNSLSFCFCVFPHDEGLDTNQQATRRAQEEEASNHTGGKGSTGGTIGTSGSTCGTGSTGGTDRTSGTKRAGGARRSRKIEESGDKLLPTPLLFMFSGKTQTAS